jgi:hypothetical protein
MPMSLQLRAQRLGKRQSDRLPCPSNSPSEIGSTQQFSVSCGLDLVGADLIRQPADSLTDCVNICASTHHNDARCEAVTYEASAAHGSNNCYLKSSVPALVQQPFEVDSAVAIWP